MRATIGYIVIHIDLDDKDSAAGWIFIFNTINATGSSQGTDNYFDGI